MDIIMETLDEQFGNMEDLSVDEESEKFLHSSRFWIQRVLVPLLVFIGIGGNIVTVMVLTRRRMRCTTTIYLTALAIADVIYLLFVLLLSFQHYPNIHHSRYLLYWRFVGITHWICDAASSASVWLTVSFTIERYIVVCHPIKGKVLCTESRAKHIITAVTILCLLTTLSTTFEYQLSLNEHCDVLANATNDGSNFSIKGNPLEENATKANEELLQISNVPSERPKVHENASEMGEIAQTPKLNDCFHMNNTCCKISHEVFTESTSLSNNTTYKEIMYWYSSISFGLLPLILIATFNCFLISAVYKSQIHRKKMTNSQESVTQRQENRVTLLLIGIIILFLICQTPTASFLIYDALVVTTDEYANNIKRALGNIFNFMITFNASCNFILYCVLSDKYRRTFRFLFCERRLNRYDTATISRSRLSQRFNSNSIGFKRSKTEYGRTPRNLEAQSLTSIPRTKSLLNRPMGKANSNDLLV